MIKFITELNEVSTPHGGLATFSLEMSAQELGEVSTPHGGLATLYALAVYPCPVKFQLHTVD